MINKVIVFLLSSLLFCGCLTNVKNGECRLANPNNVYRFPEDVVMRVLVQDESTGVWYEPKYKIRIPVGYYIGSGLE